MYSVSGIRSLSFRARVDLLLVSGTVLQTDTVRLVIVRNTSLKVGAKGNINEMKIESEIM